MTENPFAVVKTKDEVKAYHPYPMSVMGYPGTGKSTFLKSIADKWGEDSLVVLDTEGRLTEQGVPHIPMRLYDDIKLSQRADKMYAFLDAILFMAENRHAKEVTIGNHTFPNAFQENVRVFAIDTLDTLYTAIETSRFAGSQGDKPEEQWKIPFTVYVPIYREFMRRVNRFLRLSKSGITPIITLHLKSEVEKATDGSERTIYKPALRPAIIDPIMHATTVNLVLTSGGAGGTNQFITYSQEGVYPAKDGSGRLPFELPSTWAAYVAALEGRFEYSDEFEPNLPHRARRPKGKVK